MFIDLNRLSSTQALRTEVCIIGGGIAGLVIAMELERAGIASIVLESGGFKADEATRDLNRGSSSGDVPYQFGDGCRSRFLGGSSNCWGGFCRAFDESDMATRSWVPNSGWPISHSDLVPYFKRAHEWLELGPYNYDTEYWVKAINRPEVKRLPLDGSGLTDAISQFSPPVRFGKRYRAHLKASRLITVVLHANLTRFDCDADGVRIDSVQATSLYQRQLAVQATHFVLAAGGIENSRLLLACCPRHPGGLGNHHDQVGRYFMDHPRILNMGKVIPGKSQAPLSLYDTRYTFNQRKVVAAGTRFTGQVMPTDEVRRAQRLTNSGIWLRSIFRDEDSAQSLAASLLKRRLTGQRKQLIGGSTRSDLIALLTAPAATLRFAGSRWWPSLMQAIHAVTVCIVEPVPMPHNRITLSERRDALGTPRSAVHWQVGEQERRTFATTLAKFHQLLSAQGGALIESRPGLLQGQDWQSHLDREGTWHHMGGTRMHDSPRHGVVDRNCQVHGLQNLFAAGSSVFPTAGANFPTVNLVALASRLADHLSRKAQPDLRERG
jgi:choline dehydrogenase-like flavoprotein